MNQLIDLLVKLLIKKQFNIVFNDFKTDITVPKHDVSLIVSASSISITCEKGDDK